MKEIPPSFARAIASLSSETDCIMAETKGIFIVREGFSPFLNLTSGVFKSTFAGIHSADEYPGTNKYSPKVCEGSSK